MYEDILKCKWYFDKSSIDLIKCDADLFFNYTSPAAT